MSTPSSKHEERVIFSLLLAGLIITAVAMVREGPYFDNVLDGWRFFSITFFGGMLAGFVGWTRYTGAEPKLSLSGADRHPWLAALVLGLAVASASSYLNRVHSAAPARAIVAGIEGVEEGRGDRWHVTVKLPDGTYQRLLVPEPDARSLREFKAVRLGIARGLLGYDHYATFVPVAP